ncbi:MAG: hypothetical protein QOF51_3797 [Chloroflexota bacterium]|jgi:hypothetical protein|nr:hypothetical protein [Chloroflexota bacterium]
MDRIRLAYRDNDRTPVIYCIREMARRHYDVDVEVLRIQPTEEYEAALFAGAADVLIEHTEYLFGEPIRGRNVTMFCAPCIIAESNLVAPASIATPEQLAGGTVAIRAAGRPQASIIALRGLGLEGRVQTIIVPDSEVGRWGQWKKVVSGECVATFMSSLYLPHALEAGLHLLETPPLEVIGQFAQACLTSFAAANDDLLNRYVKAVIHALCLMKLQPTAALEIAAGEPMKLMKIADTAELARAFESIVAPLQLKPYPTPEALTHTYEIALVEYPSAEGLNPLAMWDVHWVKQLDDSGFVDDLIASMR